jgi:hypothetical protein
MSSVAKKQKIKRYRDGGAFYRAKPHPAAIILALVAAGVLVFLGVSVYEPVAEFFRELTSPTEPELDLPPPPTVATEAPTPPPTEPEPVLVFPDTKAAYLPPAVLADEARLNAALENIAGSDVNTILVDIKDANGTVLYNTKNAEAITWGAVAENPLDLAAFARRLEEEELMLAVRIHAFQDSLAASSNRDYAIRYQDLEWLWLDAAEADGGRPWLNPYSEGAKQYITSLCLEAADAGAKLVMLDSFQFPLGSANNANFGSRAGVVSRGDMLRSYQKELSAKLEEKEARTAIYMPALAIAQDIENETRYGGNPLYIAGDSVVLGALPYQFPAGFAYGDVAATQPFADPGDATELALAIGMDAQSFAEEAPDYIPLLQGGSEPSRSAIPFTPAGVQAQLDAVQAHGVDEYILYVTDGNYLIDGETATSP